MYLLIFANWSQAVPNYALKFSLPAIIKGMGYTSANAQLLTIPPYICGALSSYGFAVVADRTSWRMPFIVIPQCCVVIGYSILSAKAEHIVDNIAVCYFAVCVACFGYVVKLSMKVVSTVKVNIDAGSIQSFLAFKRGT